MVIQFSLPQRVLRQQYNKAIMIYNDLNFNFVFKFKFLLNIKRNNNLKKLI